MTLRHLLAAALVVTACYRPPPPGTAPSDGARSAEPESPRGEPEGDAARPRDTPPDEEDSAARPSAPIDFDAEAELENLLATGPIFVPVDQGPEIVWDTDAEATLSTRLLPVLRAEDLPAATKVRLWLLVSAEGRVVDTVVHTTSGNGTFDETGAEVARLLRFRPAVRSDRSVPVWVLREISMLMQ